MCSCDSQVFLQHTSIVMCTKNAQEDALLDNLEVLWGVSLLHTQSHFVQVAEKVKQQLKEWFGESIDQVSVIASRKLFVCANTWASCLWNLEK